MSTTYQTHKDQPAFKAEERRRAEVRHYKYMGV